MTEPLSDQQNPRDGRLQLVCQIALWAIVAIKAGWLAMAVAFVGLPWQILTFGCCLVLLIAAAWEFKSGWVSLGLMLAWVGVLGGFAVGYYGGPQPGPLTDRLHDQFRTHTADLAFLLVAHLLFFIVRRVHPIEHAAPADGR
jgi:hypothetical protein